MSTRIVVAVVLAIVVFALYSWNTTRSEGFDDFVESRVVASSGPSAPSQRPPPIPMRVSPDEQPYDPLAHSEDSAEIPERLRYPERSFGPSVQADPGLQAEATAMASQEETQKSSQSFGPSFAQNDGLFLEGVVAHDSTLETSYSSI